MTSCAHTRFHSFSSRAHDRFHCNAIKQNQSIRWRKSRKCNLIDVIVKVLEVASYSNLLKQLHLFEFG